MYAKNVLKASLERLTTHYLTSLMYANLYTIHGKIQAGSWIVGFIVIVSAARIATVYASENSSKSSNSPKWGNLLKNQ